MQSAPSHLTEERSALAMAGWLCAHVKHRPDALTHLKLQKLEFYCYGALLALELDAEVGKIAFQAWKHGPVAPTVYRQYGRFKSESLPPPAEVTRFSPAVESVLNDTVNVYGRLAAWQLREESHSETPWLEKFDGTRGVPLDDDAMRAHFKAKFAGTSVMFPERMFGASSMLLDRIAVPTFASLSEMSKAATRIFGV